VKIKQRPEDFVVREGYRFEQAPEGPVWVYRMDKQKVSTLQALERLSKEFSVRRRDLSVCGLKDKQGRTEQLVGVFGGALGPTEVVQSGDLRLKLIGRVAQPLTSANITANRFEVTVRDLSPEEAARVPESVAEVQRVGVVNYFDSQRFGFLKHGQGFIAKQLVRGDWEGALRAFLATPSELDKSDDAKVKAFWREHWGEWQLHAPQDAGKRYAPVLRQLREDPKDFKGAFMHIDRRLRMMVLFELQSYVWNEGAKRYLALRVPSAELIGLRYQAGALTFPRSLPRELRDQLWAQTFPLLAPDSKFDDPQIEASAVGALKAQGLGLPDLQVPETRQLFFKHEERPLFVVPGKLRVNEPRRDELNRGRLKVNLSFTLPPGAYATLVVRRVLWFATESKRSNAPVGRAWGRPLEKAGSRLRAPGFGGTGGEVSQPRLAAQKPPEAPREKMGFLERQRARKEARAMRRAGHKKG
jgi:tRNA pseudouridine13 synthase